MSKKKAKKTCGDCAYACVKLATGARFCTCEGSSHSGEEVDISCMVCECFKPDDGSSWEEMKPCPFCGSKDIDYDFFHGDEYEWDKGWFVQCFEPKCAVKLGPYETKREAVEAWNSRRNGKWKALAEKAKALNDETLCFLHEAIKREHAFIAISVFEACIILALLVFFLWR